MRGLLVAEGPLRVPSGQALRQGQGERNRELTLRGMSKCGVSRLWPAVRLFWHSTCSGLGAFQLQIQNSFCRGTTTPPLSGAERARSSRRTVRARGAVVRKWRRCAVPWGESSRGVGVGARGSCQGGGPSSALRTGFDRLRANGFGRGASGGEWGMRWGTETPRPCPGFPRFTNEVQHQSRVLAWEKHLRRSPWKSGVRLPSTFPGLLGPANRSRCGSPAIDGGSGAEAQRFPAPWATSPAMPTSRPPPVVGGAPGWSGTVPCGEQVLAGLGAGWSPAQVAGRLALDEGRQIISHESIYRFIYAQMARKKDYSWRHYLPRAKAKRGFRGRRGGSPATHIAHRVPLSQRPHAAADRATFGHWEGDLMHFGNHGPALLALAERHSRLVLLARLPAREPTSPPTPSPACWPPSPRRGARPSPSTTAPSSPATTASMPWASRPSSAIPAPPGRREAWRPCACGAPSPAWGTETPRPCPGFPRERERRWGVWWDALARGVGVRVGPALAGGRFANRPYDRGGAHEGGGDAGAGGGGGPFDRLRANGFGRGACGGGTETPRAPPLWISAFAGMTRVGECGQDERWCASGWGPFDRLRANGFGRGAGGGEWGMRWGTGDAPRRAPALGSRESGNDDGRCGGMRWREGLVSGRGPAFAGGRFANRPYGFGWRSGIHDSSLWWGRPRAAHLP